MSNELFSSTCYQMDRFTSWSEILNHILLIRYFWHVTRLDAAFPLAQASDYANNHVAKNKQDYPPDHHWLEKLVTTIQR